MADLAAVPALLALARWARLGDPGLASMPDWRLPVLTLAVVAVFYVLDLHTTTRPRFFERSLPVRALAAVLALVPVLALHAYLITGSSFQDAFMGRGSLALFLAGLLPWCLLSRLLARALLHPTSDASRWLVVGGEGAGLDDFRDNLRGSPPHGMEFRLVRHGTEEADDALAKGGWDGVAIDDGAAGPEAIGRLARTGSRVLALEDLHESLWEKIPLSSLERRSAAALSVNRSLLRDRSLLRVKRVLDVALALALLAPALPLVLLAAALIKLEDGGPVIYRQTRTGLGGARFPMLKLRSMRTDAERDGALWTEAKDARITRIGRCMRLVHFDEVPQLVNVLRGEMSLVGPRPELPEQIALFEKNIPSYALRHSVKPGLTGWAQVLHPYGPSVVEDARKKLQYDLYYIKRLSLALDVAILAKTVRIVLFGMGR